MDEFINPLLKSGILLAGAKNSLTHGTTDAQDGIVTAEEILGLNLHGTEMAVLSACDTGLGEVKSGEGVFGLRRAFTQAGAKSLVMSLWKVPDTLLAQPEASNRWGSVGEPAGGPIKWNGLFDKKSFGILQNGFPGLPEATLGSNSPPAKNPLTSSQRTIPICSGSIAGSKLPTQELIQGLYDDTFDAGSCFLCVSLYPLSQPARDLDCEFMGRVRALVCYRVMVHGVGSLSFLQDSRSRMGNVAEIFLGQADE